MPAIEKKQKPKARPKQPLWKGPEEDGITQSLLSRFLVCRERFRLLVLEGLQPAPKFNHRLEYGNMWHICEEGLAAKLPDWVDPLQSYCQELCKKYTTDQEQVDKWYNVCKVQFPVYVDYWKRNEDVKNRVPLFQEEKFAVPYKLPSGRVVTLRGKWDSVDLIGKGKNARVYLQENKTKGEIVPDKIASQLQFDLQTMMYLVSLNEYYQNAKSGDKLFDRDYGPPAGVRYNVVRRPLSGGKGSIKQLKGSKNKPPETKVAFYQRLGGIIRDNPEEFFMRWKVEIIPADIQRFEREFLVPVLEQLCDWWEWVSVNPWGMGNNIHWRYPYGVYNVLLEGGSTELDAYLDSGSKVGLVSTTELFPELQ